MYKLEITLKQHTPLIHFQHDQEGATLRASEVKPKLDKFILTKLGENPTEEDFKIGEKEAIKEENNIQQLDSYNQGFFIAKGKGWLIGDGEHPALACEMKISANVNKNLKIPIEEKKIRGSNGNMVCDHDNNGNVLYKTTFPFILSNMGGKISSELVNFSYSDSIRLILCTFYADLIEFIKINIYEFFILQNFGSRCNKGFGSFSVIKINDQQKGLSEEYFKENTQILEFDLPNNEINLRTFKKIFSIIEYYWKRLKPGVNYGQFEYSKSFLFTYINKIHHVTWEKQKIKEKFHIGITRQNANPNTPIFARALLGLPDKFEYGSRTISISHPEIERIMSPIYFKPIIDDNSVTIYVLIKDEHLKDIPLDCENFVLDEGNIRLKLPFNVRIDYEDLLIEFQSSFNEDNGINFFEPIEYNGQPILGNNNRVNINVI